MDNPLQKILVPVALAGGKETRASDDRAVALACELRDRAGTGEIVAVGMSYPAGEEAVLAALARGADRAVLVQSDHADRQASGYFLRAIVWREKPDLVVVGSDPPDMGPYLAGALNIPQAIGAVQAEIDKNGSVAVVCEVDRIRQRFILPMPGLLGASAALPDPSILSLYAIVAAREKPMVRVRGSKLARLPARNVETLSIERAEHRRVGKIVGSVDELIDALRYEAHVI